jgi:hypothetical protein
VTAQYHGGDEFLGTRKSWRNLVDVVALYSPAGKTSYSFNFDWVNQSGAHLYGLSAMAKYAIDDRSYLAARGEFLVDDGFLGTNAYEVTLGYSRKLHQYLETRAEFRYDWASQDVFANDRRGRFKDTMPTFLISAIVSYQ